ncbi:unnamed protein product [Paramecium sonneborni]|uniref:Transmembrane protein n=1 Tax=Paramecium sonneborni TaxID=65129 RepID=A0A8S1RJV5_9CILI|nr:unnamed protein product [Paramecium sonneborni]
MKNFLILLNILIFSSFGQVCDTIQQQYNVYGTVNEIQEWDMRRFFFKGENLKFKINEDCPYFETIDPFAEIGDPISHRDPSIGIIRSLKAYRSFENGAWLNDFIFLEQNKTDVDVFYSYGDPQKMDKVPSFSGQINARNQTKNFVCFDVDFLTNSKIVVDCYQKDLDDETKGYMNGFIVVDVASPDKYALFPNEHPEGYRYNFTEYRKILFHNYTYSNGDRQALLFRGEPTWATEHADLVIDKLDDDCELEVYKFDNKFNLTNPSPVAVLTKKVLANLLGTSEAQQKFYLVDFQLEPDGSIYVLDAFNGVYVLYFESANLEWKLKNHINPPYLTPCFGFDFNYLEGSNGNITYHLVLVFKNSVNFYENDVQKFSIKTPNITSYKNLQVQMSQYYLVLRIDTYLHLYHSGTGEKLYTFTQNLFDQVIINPYEPDLLGVNENSAHRFLISNGLLRLKYLDSSNDGMKPYTLRAISLDNSSKECQVSINVQVLKKNDISIRAQSYHPFPASLTVPSPPIPIDLIASGPNLQYNSIVSLENSRGNNKVILTVKSVWNLQLNGITPPEAKDVEYSDVLVNENSGVFYLLVQIPSKEIFVYRCSHKLNDHEQADCKNYDKFQLDHIIDKKKHSFEWWIYTLYVTYMYQDTDFTIQIYTSAGGNVQHIGTIEVDKSSPDNKIDSVTFLEDEVYVVQSKLKKVQIYSKYMPFQLIYEINDNKLAQFNVKGNFTPQRVFANKKAKSSLIFIQTINSLFIGTFSNDKISSFILQKEISLLPGAQVEVAIGIENFFIVQKLDDKDVIEEYNYKHMQIIYKTKELPLYDYKLQNPLTVDYSSQTGWLFVRAKDDKQTVILVYEPGVVSHICLHKVLETKALDLDGQTFDMAVDGSNQMFAYFNNNTIHRFLSILADAELYATPILDSQDYVSDVIVGIEITNFPKNNPFLVQNSMKILNSQSTVTINQKLFDSKQKVFKFVKQEAEQIIDMDTNWYSGQVTSFYVICQKCGSNLTIRPNIQRVADGTDMKYDISDGAVYGKYGQVYQAKNSLIFQDQKGKFLSRFDMKLTSESCELVAVSEDLSFILSSWHNTKNEVGVYVSICSQQTQQPQCQQYRQGTQVIGGIQQISKIQMVDNKNIIILNSNPENFASIDNMIIVATFIYDEKSFSISNKYLINDQYVGTKLLQIGDFDIVKYQVNSVNYNTIIFTDINQGLYFAHFAYDAQGAFSKTTSELFKIQTIQDNQLHLEDDTKFYQVKVISNQVSGTTLQLNILVTTNNVAHYVLAFDLDVSQPAQSISIIKKNTKLLYVLTPYGTWPTIDKLAYVNGHVAIPYTDENYVLIGIYDVPNDRPTTVKSIPFTHSVIADYQKALPIDFALLLTKDSDSKFPNLYVNIDYDRKSEEYLIQKYQLRADPQLVLKNSTNLDDEVPITIQLSNQFTQSVGQAYLSINGSPPPPPPKPDDDESSSNWWWITLIVIFGVALLGVGGYFAYKKFYKKEGYLIA